jgi:hypothetical protein
MKKKLDDWTKPSLLWTHLPLFATPLVLIDSTPLLAGSGKDGFKVAEQKRGGLGSVQPESCQYLVLILEVKRTFNIQKRPQDQDFVCGGFTCR